MYLLIGIGLYFGINGDDTLSLAGDAARQLLDGFPGVGSGSPMNPLWTLVPPLAVIPFILFFGEKRRNLREGAIIIAGLLLLLINNLIYNDLMAGGTPQSGEFALMANYSLKLSAEPMGVIFGLLASFLWVVTTVYSIGYMRGHHEINQTRFYSCFALALAAVMGAAYADNLLTLFVAYEVITISTFPLVTHAGGEAARKAGKVYIGILMSTSIAFLLPAIIWTASVAGTMDFVAGGVLKDAGLSHGALAIMMALFVFGIAKAGLMPFSSMVACSDGCTHTGQCLAACRSGSEDRCVQYSENCDLYVRYRYRDNQWCRLLVAAVRRIHHCGCIVCCLYQGQSESKTCVLNHWPVGLYCSGSFVGNRYVG